MSAERGPAAGGQDGAQAAGGSSLRSLGLPPPAFHSLVLDLGALAFADTVCLKSLKNVRAGRPGRAGVRPRNQL